MDGCSITLMLFAEVRLLEIVVTVGIPIEVSIDLKILLKLDYWRLWALWTALQDTQYFVCMCLDWYTCGCVYEWMDAPLPQSPLL